MPYKQVQHAQHEQAVVQLQVLASNGRTTPALGCPHLAASVPQHLLLAKSTACLRLPQLMCLSAQSRPPNLMHAISTHPLC